MTIKTTITRTSALLGLTLSLVACGSDDSQVEPVRAALRAGEDAEASACFTVYTSLTGAQRSIFQIHADDRPVRWPSGEVMTVGGTNAESFCVPAGDHDFSLVLGSHTIGSTGPISTSAGQGIGLTFYGSVEDAHASWFAAGDAEPCGGLVEARVTNLAFDQKPVVLVYKTTQGEEVARSAPVAYGQTWTGMVPVAGRAWEVADSSVDKSWFSSRCDYKNALGVVLLSDRAGGRQAYMPELLLPNGKCPFQEDEPAID